MASILRFASCAICSATTPMNPQFIQTVTGKGYRFLATVSSNEPALLAPGAHCFRLQAPHRIRGAGCVAGIWAPGSAPSLRSVEAGFIECGIIHRRSSIRSSRISRILRCSRRCRPMGTCWHSSVAAIPSSTSDQIYVKMLPSGEPRRVTDDNRPKYALAFSPDGSEIAYTVMEGSTFSTYEVSALGGESRLLMQNAAGLVWLDPRRLLFSEASSGIHLGAVTATVARTNLREIYFPAHQRAMIHYSFPSPDRRWALLVEMDGNGDWAPCRLVSLEGQPSMRIVGPAGACTSAGWSPDGRWMYFTAAVQGQSHIWRQHFPQGEPEQITSGPTEENGIAVEPDGRSLITSLGVQESAVWIHDSTGERSLSSEGEVLRWPTPVFSQDASVIYYLVRRWESSDTELWGTIVDSGKSEPVFPGIRISAFDISPDDKQVVYTTDGMDGVTQLWLAPLDRTLPPSETRYRRGKVTAVWQPRTNSLPARGGIRKLPRADQSRRNTSLKGSSLSRSGLSGHFSWPAMGHGRSSPDAGRQLRRASDRSP